MVYLIFLLHVTSLKFNTVPIKIMTPSTEKCRDKPLSLSWIGLIYKRYQLCDVPLNNWQQQNPPLSEGKSSSLPPLTRFSWLIEVKCNNAGECILEKSLTRCALSNKVLRSSKAYLQRVHVLYNIETRGEGVPCEQRFLSCLALSVYEIVGVACQLRSWFAGD